MSTTVDNFDFETDEDLKNEADLNQSPLQRFLTKHRRLLPIYIVCAVLVFFAISALLEKHDNKKEVAAKASASNPFNFPQGSNVKQEKKSASFHALPKQEVKTEGTHELLNSMSKKEQVDFDKLSKMLVALDKKIDQSMTSQTSANKTNSKGVLSQSQEITALKQAVAQLSTQVGQYSTTMADLNRSLTTTSHQLRLVLAQQTAHRQKLTLRAVVDGRAWLVNPKGVSTTVTVGSEVPGFGQVVRIDSLHEKVYMDSGYVFQ